MIGRAVSGEVYEIDMRSQKSTGDFSHRIDSERKRIENHLEHHFCMFGEGAVFIIVPFRGEWRKIDLLLDEIVQKSRVTAWWIVRLLIDCDEKLLILIV